MTVTICHYKPQSEDEAGVWMMSCLEEMVLRILFEKTSVDIGPLKREFSIRPLRVGFWPSKDVVGFFGSLPTEILNITRCAASWGGVIIVRIVSLSLCRHRPKPETNKPVRIWNNRVRLCILYPFVYELLWWSWWLWLYNTIFWVFGMTRPGFEPRSPGSLGEHSTY